MTVRKKTVSPKSKKKVTKKAVVSRPTNKKKTTVKKSVKTSSKRPPKTVSKKSSSKTQTKSSKTRAKKVTAKVQNNKFKRKPALKAKKPVVFKPDTTLSCHDCGKVEKVNFEYIWVKSGWPRCCNEGMHIEDSSIKIGEVMNKAWVNSGGYGGSLNLAI